MRKRFLSFLLTLTMLLTLVVLPAGAETTLTLDSYNIITNAIRLEFSSAITEAAVSVKTTDGTALAVGNPSISENVVNVKLTDKMDIEKSYVLDFTVTDGTNTLTAKKLITFTVYWNDDFESYESTSDLDTNYIRYYGDGAKYDAFTNLKSSGLETVDGNKKMKIASTSADSAGVWINKSGWTSYGHGKKYYTLEADFSVINAHSSGMWMRYNTSYIFSYQTMSFYTSYVSVQQNRLFTENPTKDVAYSDWNSYNNMTLAISTYKKASSDSFDVFWNGKNLYHNEGTLTATNEGNSVYGIMSTYGDTAFYVDNWKIYTASLTDYVETGLKYCNVTTKAIQLVYDNAVDTANMPTVSLKNGAITVATTQKFYTATNTLVITPENPLDLSKAYTLNVTGVCDEAGIELPEFSKAFEFETLFYDDFESYNEAADLDNKYMFAIDDTATTNYNKKAADAPEYTIVDDQVMSSRVLKMNTSTYAITPKLTGNFALNHKNKYYTLEFDIRSQDDCWRFQIPMYQCANYNQTPFMMFASHQSNMYILGLFGMTGWGTDANPAPSYPNGLTTMAITVDSYSDTTDFEALSYNGVPARVTTDYKFTDTYSRHFAFRSSVKKDADGNQVDNIYYIDNLKAYRVEDLAEIPEGNIAFSDAVIDSEKITLTYDADVTADVSLTADGETYAVNTTFADSKIVIKPQSGKFDMNKQYNLKITSIADRFGRLAPDYDKTFRFKLIWEDDFSTYNAQSDLDSNYFVVGGYKKPSEVMNTENDYLYKLDSENDRLILNGTDGITSIQNQNSKQFIMPVFNPDNMSLDYWKDYSFEYTLSKEAGTYYRIESYYNPWVAYDQGLIIPSANYNWIYYGVWYSMGNYDAAQIIIDGNKSAEINAPSVSEDEVNIKILIDEDAKVRVYKGETELYENATDDWEGVTEGIPFMFRNSGVAGDKYYLDNLLAYKVIFIEENDLYLTDVSYADNKVTANVKATSGEEAANGEVFIAAYDQVGKLVGVSETASLVLGEAIPVEISNAQNVKFVRAFAWESGNMKPITIFDTEIIK